MRMSGLEFTWLASGLINLGIFVKKFFPKTWFLVVTERFESFKKCFHHFAEDFHYFADDFHYFAEDFHFFVEDFQSQISKTPNDGSGEKTQNKISCETPKKKKNFRKFFQKFFLNRLCTVWNTQKQFSKKNLFLMF